MGLRLSDHLDEEVLRARTALALPPERVADILPEDPTGGIAALPKLGWLRDLLREGPPRQVAAADALADAPLSPLGRRGQAGASNVWAAGPSRTTTGGTLLANDPHLGFTAPSIWYLARIELATGGVIGGTIPGLPLILSGRSDTLAWGLTTAYADDLDIYLERLDPDDPGRYLTPAGDYRAFRSERSVIRVSGAEPVTITLRWTDRGPVLPGDVFDLARVTPEGHAASIAWTALERRDTTMTAAMRLMRARGVGEAIEVMAGHVAPVQNLALADSEGRIALQTIGALPRRSALHETLGRLPSRGWRAQNHWQGRLDYDRNPRFVDPEGGILGNTNNKIVERPFPLHVSHRWGDSQRVLRWRRLMQEREVHSRESFVEAQLDTVSQAARTLLPLGGLELWYAGEAAPAGSRAARRARALEMLADWNGEMNEHLAEPLIYAAWMRALQRRLAADELGPLLAERFARPDPLFIERVFRDVNGAAAWCDVRGTEARESCPEIARRALDDALVWLEETQRGPLAELHWGAAHTATHDHEVLGGLPLMGWLVNIRQPVGGGDNTLLRTQTTARDPAPMASGHGPGYRGVYDMADPDASQFVIATGQSGHPFSRHYADMAELWRRGDYVPMSLDPEIAEAAATGITTLRPAGAN